MRSKFLLVPLLALALLMSSLTTAFADDDEGDGDGQQTTFPLTDFPPSERDNAVLQWNEEALECIRATRPAPPVVARALFIVHSSVYDGWTFVRPPGGADHPHRLVPAPVAPAHAGEQEPGVESCGLPCALERLHGLRRSLPRPSRGAGPQHR